MNSSDLSNGFDFERWAKRFKERATRDLTASRSWRRLRELGFSERLIALGFYYACDFPKSPGNKALAELQQESRRKAARARRLIRRLEEDRNEICALFGASVSPERPKASEPPLSEGWIESDNLFGLKEIFSRSVTGAHERNTSDTRVRTANPESSVSETVLAQFSNLAPLDLASEKKAPASPTATKGAYDRDTVIALDGTLARIRKFEMETRKLASKRTNNLSFFVALELTFIKRKAGQPLYRDYAALLNVANNAFGHDELEVGEDAVRKTFQRFVKRNPDAFDWLDEPIALAIFVVAMIAHAEVEKSN